MNYPIYKVFNFWLLLFFTISICVFRRTGNVVVVYISILYAIAILFCLLTSLVYQAPLIVRMIQNLEFKDHTIRTKISNHLFTFLFEVLIINQLAPLFYRMRVAIFYKILSTTDENIQLAYLNERENELKRHNEQMKASDLDSYAIVALKRNALLGLALVYVLNIIIMHSSSNFGVLCFGTSTQSWIDTTYTYFTSIIKLGSTKIVATTNIEKVFILTTILEAVITLSYFIALTPDFIKSATKSIGAPFVAYNEFLLAECREIRIQIQTKRFNLAIAEWHEKFEKYVMENMLFTYYRNMLKNQQGPNPADEHYNNEN